MTLAGTQGLSWRLHAALVSAGWRISTGASRNRILCGSGVPLDEVAAHRDFMLGGGKLLLLGGEGPLLARLHLTPEQKEIVEGEAASFHPSFQPMKIARVHPVHGVGYAFLRVGDAVVALGGPRGTGHFVYLAEMDPEPELLLAAMRWLAEPQW